MLMTMLNKIKNNMKKYHTKSITNQELYDEMQKVKKALQFLLDNSNVPSKQEFNEGRQTVKRGSDKMREEMLERRRIMQSNG